jgi:outer membrane protein TolC
LRQIRFVTRSASRWAATSIALAALAALASAAIAQEPPAPTAQPAAPPPPVTPPAFPSVAEEARPEAFPVITGPRSVDDAIALALRQNPLIALGEREVDRAAAEVDAARATTQPTLSATGYAMTGNLDAMFTGPPGVAPMDMGMVPTGSYAAAGLRALLPLYTGGKLRATVRRAESLYRAAGANLTTLRLNVVVDARVKYHSALQAGELVKVYQQLVATEEENARVARDLYDQGKIPLFDLLRTQTELADAIQQLTNARNEEEAALARLKTTLGVDLSSTPELAAPDAEGGAIPALSEALPAADKQRPELAALSQRVAAARQQVRQATAAYRPQVYAVGAERFFGGSDIDSDNGGTVGVVASIPILDGGSRRAAVRAAEAQQAREQAAWESMRLQVREEATTAWLRAQTAQQNVVTSQAALTQAQEDYRIATERYRAGKSIVVELYDVLTALVKAQTNEVNARYELAIAAAELDRATGASP